MIIDRICFGVIYFLFLCCLYVFYSSREWAAAFTLADGTSECDFQLRGTSVIFNVRKALLLKVVALVGLLILIIFLDNDNRIWIID